MRNFDCTIMRIKACSMKLNFFIPNSENRGVIKTHQNFIYNSPYCVIVYNLLFGFYYK